MAVRFVILQQSSPFIGIDQSRHDLVVDEEIQLSAVEPEPAPDIAYVWEIIDRAGTTAELTSNEGKATTIAASSTRPFGFLVELRAYKNGTLLGSSRRICGARSPVRNLRLPMFSETADASSRIQSARPGGSTDNAVYDDLAGQGQQENWRGWAEFLYELVLAIESAGGGEGGSGDATFLRGRPVEDVAPAVDDSLLFRNGAWRPGKLALPEFPELQGDVVRTAQGGAPTDLTVRALQGIDVSSDDPADGQFLGYGAGEWRPTTPTFQVPPAKGDVTGAFADLVVERLRGHPVAAATPVEGQILQWVESLSVWTPRTLSADGDVKGPLDTLVVSALRGHPLLQAVPAPGQLLGWREAPTPGWVPVDPPELPELPAPSGDAISLQGREVAQEAPNTKDVLAWDGDAWAPMRPPIAGYEIDPLQTPTHGSTLILADDGLSPPQWRFGPSDTMDADSLRERPIADAQPADGDRLVFRAGAWTPEPEPPPPTPLPLADRTTDGYLGHDAYAEFDDKVGLQSRAFGAVATPVHVYVSTTGDDAQDGSIATPRRTLAGAYGLLPLLHTGVFIIHFAAGVYDYAAPPPHLVAAPWETCFIFVGDGAGQAGDDGWVEVAAGTVGAGSTGMSIVTSDSPAVDAYAYCTLLINNNGKDRRRLIPRNTTTAIEPALSLDVNPTVGTPYRVVRPAVTLNFPTSGPRVNAYGQHSLNGAALQVNFVQLAFTGAPVRTEVGSFVLMLGVELCDNCTLANLSETLCSGANAGTAFGRMYDVPALLGAGWEWEGWGIAQRTPNVNAFVSSGNFHGYISVAGRMDFRTAGETARVSSWRGGRCSSLIVSYYHGFGCYNAPCYVICSEDVIAVNVSGRFSGNQLHVQQNGASPGVVIQRSGSMHFGNFTVTCTVAGHTAMRVLGEFGFELNPCSMSSVGAPALHVDGGRVRSNYWLICTASASGTGAVLVESGGVINGCGPYGGLTVQNTGAGASTDGLRIRSGGLVVCAYASTISTTGSSGYGVNCRGAGRFVCPGQPTDIAGPTADFSVGTGAGDDFNDTDLAVAYAARTSGLSGVARSA